MCEIEKKVQICLNGHITHPKKERQAGAEHTHMYYLPLVENKKCQVCNKNQNQSRVRFLYCITCLKHFCDDCNPFLSDQIDIYRSTDEAFYCPSCSAFYPC